MGFAEVGEDVAVEVAACWEAVEEEDWFALACFEVVEAEVVDLGVVARRLGHRVMMPASEAFVTRRFMVLRSATRLTARPP